MSWQTRSSRITYENRWIRVREDQVIGPDGRDGVYGVVTLRQPAVFVVAMTDADEIVLVTVDRYTTGPSIEVPAGGTDGEEPLVAAQRELREETGLVADQWTEVGRMNALNGVCEADEIVYLATGLSRVDDGAGQHEEGITAVRAVPVAELLGMVQTGMITDGETVAAVMITLLHLGRVS